MVKGFYILIISLLISLCGYFVALSFLNYFLLERSNIILNLNISEPENTLLLTHFDQLSVNNNWHEGTIKLTEESKQISIEITFDIQVKGLFLIAKDSTEFVLNSIDISNSKNDFHYNFNELNDKVNQGYFNLKKSKPLNKSHKGLIVELDKNKKHLEINRLFFNDLYERAKRPIKNGALIFQILIFIASIIFLNRSDRIKANYQTVFFFTFILLLSIGFFSPKEHTTDENRKLVPYPSFKINVWKIPAKYTNYFTDHFPFRSKISKLSSKIKASYLNISPNPDLVQIGKDGWLFLSEKNLRAVSRGEVLYTDDELKKIKLNLETKEKKINTLGAEFYIFIPPLKHSVYFEKLPISMSRGQYNKKVQLMNFLKTNSTLNIIDVYPMLLAKKDSVEVYYQTDTHWNQLGGFFAYREMIKEINKKFPNVGEPKSLEDYSISTKEEYSGDLLQMINIYDEFKRNVFLMSPDFSKQAGELVIEQPKYAEAKYSSFTSPMLIGKPRLLMYRDSYSEYMYKHISEHFSYYGLAWTRTINESRINEVKPDIVVFEMMERYVDRLMDDDLLLP